MNMRRRTLLGSLLAVPAVGVLAACGDDKPAAGGSEKPGELTPITYGYIPDFNGTSLLAIANDQKLWEKHGLKANLQTFTNGPLQIQAIGTGDLDFGYIGPGAMWLPASGKATGLVMSPGAGKVTFEITDASGVVVDTIEVEADAKGETAFAWDGVKANGERAPEGRYSIKASHTASDGTATALNTYVDATVDSVTIGSDGLYLNLPGLGTAPLDYVLRIGKSAS